MFNLQNGNFMGGEGSLLVNKCSLPFHNQTLTFGIQISFMPHNYYLACLLIL